MLTISVALTDCRCQLGPRKQSLMRIPDLCFVIYDFCDNATLLKLSMTCKYTRK